MNRLIAFFFLLFFPALVWTGAASASAATGASAFDGAQEVKTRLISPSLTTGNSAQLTLGLEVQMQPGWHIYWRTPGLAGLPATLDWSGSTNFKDAQIRWPAPQRLLSQGLETFGYLDYAVLPITVTLADATKPATFKTAVSLLACAELCVPFNFNLTLELPAGAATDSPYQAILAPWLARVPGSGTADFDILHASAQGNTLVVEVKANPPLSAPELFVESKAGYLFPAAQLTAPNQLTVTLTTPVRDDAPLSKDEYILTLVDGDRLMEKNITPGAALDLQPKPPAQTGISLPYALFMALVGGLVLNLMPCVLPVLSLKLLTIVRHAGAPRSHIRRSFLASAAGIVSSFLVLAGLAIALKQAGVAVGWGIQFQHPAFIIPIVAMLTLFTASMWNLIEIPLPRFMADAINDRLPAPGEQDPTLLGNFMTGAFATVLATPCSAPFVGTALGFALAGSPLDITLIALAMGLGLALPYLLIAAFPAVAHYMPKPGRWMNWLRAVFGLALLISALWMASILTPQLGERPASLIGGATLFVLAILWIRRSIERPIVLIKGIIAIGLSFGALMYANQPPKDLPNPLLWQSFDEAAIPALVAQGKTVFVDVTADWCLTCHANEKFVLTAEPTRSRLTASHVVLMKADWTTPNDAITAYLKKFGRYGIPFNMAYGPAAPQGVVMPELLSAAKVAAALDQAAGQ